MISQQQKYYCYMLNISKLNSKDARKVFKVFFTSKIDFEEVHTGKMPKYWVFSTLHFLTLGQNMEMNWSKFPLTLQPYNWFEI